MALVLKPRRGRPPNEDGPKPRKPRKRRTTRKVMIDGIETIVPVKARKSKPDGVEAAKKRVVKRKPVMVLVEDGIDHEAEAAKQAATDAENSKPREYHFASKYSCYYNGSLLVFEPTRNYVLESRLANYLIMGDAPLEEVK